MNQDVEEIEKRILTLPPRTKVVGAMFLILLGTSSGFVGGWFGANSHRENGVVDTSASQQVVLNESQLISDIAKKVGESVVSVNVTSQGTARDLFGGNSEFEYESAGTGIIISEDGVIITNRHVVPAGVSDVSVTLSDGTELTEVEVLGRTSQNDPLDIAFLKVTDKKGKTLQPATMGDSSKVNVGDKVIAIGNALGQFQNTVTSGIISGYGRSVIAGDESGSENLQNLFQTDAAINEGNSGGPLVNISGEVIGINTAVAGNGAENIGFSIAINDVKGLITSVLEKGKLERPYIGVRYINLTDDYAYYYNLSVKRGAYIVPPDGVIAGSPAEKAGLQVRDVITKVDGKTVDEKNSLVSLLSAKKVGDEITLTIIRGDEEMAVTVILEAAPED